jgi:hypothetical protein
MIHDFDRKLRLAGWGLSLSCHDDL